MTEERIRGLEKKIDTLTDAVQQMFIASRESTTPSFSTLVSDLSKKLDAHIVTHEQDTQEIRDTLKPIAGAYSNVTGFRATIITFSTLALASWGLVEGWKKTLGK